MIRIFGKLAVIQLAFVSFLAVDKGLCASAVPDVFDEALHLSEDSVLNLLVPCQANPKAEIVLASFLGSSDCNLHSDCHTRSRIDLEGQFRTFVRDNPEALKRSVCSAWHCPYTVGTISYCENTIWGPRW
jgi:hypothetical protein